MNVLIMGKTEDICEGISQLLLSLNCDNITTFTSGTLARAVDIARFDHVIVSTPLSDEFGLDFVAEISGNTKNGVVVLAKREIADEVQKKLKFTGALVLARPFNKALLFQTMKFAEVARGNMEKLEAENRQLTKQISDLKLINRAKSVLMQYLNLTEEQAHRHIQKQAMDLRRTQVSVAEEILRTYQNSSEQNN